MLCGGFYRNILYGPNLSNILPICSDVGLSEIFTATSKIQPFADVIPNACLQDL